jgi:two-component sensor histidine kinase
MSMTAAAHAAQDDAAEEPLLQLVEAIEQLSAVRTVEDVAAVVLSAARLISGADGVCFVLRDGDKCHYLDEEAIGPLWKGRRFPLTACISGWAMLNRQTAVIPDIYQDTRIPHDAYRPTFVKSLVMTPVRPAEPIAAIGAYWAQVRVPTPDETAKLAAIARATATALENVRLIATLEESLKRRDLLIRELDHRVKNNLAVVRAIAQQTLRTASSPEAFSEAFMGRLMALSRAHEMVARESRGAARLRDIVEQAIAPHAHPGGAQVSISGPEVRLASEIAINLQLAVHELASNAVRHGALGAPQGQICVAWTIEDDQLALSWTERGGPPTSDPERRGFGLRFVQDALPRSLGGKAELQFAPEGLSVLVKAPLSSAIAAT